MANMPDPALEKTAKAETLFGLAKDEETTMEILFQRKKSLLLEAHTDKDGAQEGAAEKIHAILEGYDLLRPRMEAHTKMLEARARNLAAKATVMRKWFCVACENAGDDLKPDASCVLLAMECFYCPGCSRGRRHRCPLGRTFATIACEKRRAGYYQECAHAGAEAAGRTYQKWLSEEKGRAAAKEKEERAVRQETARLDRLRQVHENKALAAAAEKKAIEDSPHKQLMSPDKRRRTGPNIVEGGPCPQCNKSGRNGTVVEDVKDEHLYFSCSLWKPGILRDNQECSFFMWQN